MTNHPIDLEALSKELSVVLEKHGFTSGYVMAEVREPDSRSARFCGVATADVNGIKPTEFLVAMAEQTFAVIKTVSALDLTPRKN